MQQDIRQHIADDAARMLTDSEAIEPEEARSRAAAQLGVRDQRQWPDLALLAERWRQRATLFDAAGVHQRWHQRRALAHQAMTALQEFHPRLADPLLLGMAPPHSALRILVYPEPFESLLLALMEQGIRWNQRELSLRTARNGPKLRYPSLRFLAGGQPIVLVAMPAAERHRRIYSADGLDAWPSCSIADLEGLSAPTPDVAF
jgi:hypothetical protein